MKGPITLVIGETDIDYILSVALPIEGKDASEWPSFELLIPKGNESRIDPWKRCDDGPYGMNLVMGGHYE